MWILVAIALVLQTTAPNAAEMKVGTYDSGEAFVFIDGEIEANDAQAFLDAMVTAGSRSTKPVKDVWLNSPGGLVGEGLSIGRAIHKAGMETLVDENEQCLSACGLIWLAGWVQWISPNGMVGFHSVWSGGEVSHDGNQLVRGYLSDLGYGRRIQEYAVTANPNEMQYLTAEQARSFGLKFGLLE